MNDIKKCLCTIFVLFSSLRVKQLFFCYQEIFYWPRVAHDLIAYLLQCLISHHYSLIIKKIFTILLLLQRVLTLIIFCRLFQVSTRASMVNQVQGLGPTLKLLICASRDSRLLKSALAALREALNCSCASLRAQCETVNNNRLSLG